jgi:hypothetical protein
MLKNCIFITLLPVSEKTIQKYSASSSAAVKAVNVFAAALEAG